MSRMDRLSLVYSLVRGQRIELVIEDTETGAIAEVIGTVADVLETGPVNIVGRVHVCGRSRQLPASVRPASPPTDTDDAS